MIASSKIAAMGMSMGGVRTWTLAALAGKGLKAGIANGTFPRFREAALTGHINNHRNTQNLREEISRYGLDTEDFIFSASSTNIALQFGEKDQSSPGHEVLFDLAKEMASPDVEVKAEIEAGQDHAFTLTQIIEAYSFIAEKLQGRNIWADLINRAIQ